MGYRRSIVSAALLVPVLAACGLTAPGQSEALPQVRGEFGRKPQVTVPKVEPEPEPQVKVLAEGKGPKTSAGQVVVTDASIRVWQGNRDFLNTYDTKQPTTISFDGRHVSKTWADALIGKKAGSRVLLVSPASKGFGPWGQPPAGVSPTDSLIVVFDIIGGYAPGAQAAAASTYYPDRGLPRVTVDAGAPARITTPSAPAPGKLTTRTLVAGHGPQVQPGSTAVLQYSAANWKDGKPFDSSYGRGGPNGFIMRRGLVVPGWAEGLTGQRAGSRVLLVVPASMGRGFKTTPGGVGVPPRTTAVYVVDIIDVRGRADL